MNHHEKVETITQIRERFKDDPQWLLIRVTKMDVRTTTPLSGVLLDHNADRDIIFNKSAERIDGLILVDHSHPGQAPKGHVFAL